MCKNMWVQYLRKEWYKHKHKSSSKQGMTPFPYITTNC